MALTIIKEDGSGLTTSNSNVEVADIDAYAETLLSDEAVGWIAEASDEKKKAAAISATRMIEANVNFIGNRKTDTQALAWPRENVVVDGQEISDSILPIPIQYATAELAIMLLANGGSVSRSETDANVSSVNVGKGAVAIGFHKQLAARTIPEHISLMLGKWGTTQTENSSKGFRIAKAGR